MCSTVYEHIIIILTHGNRLAAQELENAVARMTTEFIPYLRDNLKFKVKDEILVYTKDNKNDGLEGVLEYITSNKKYKPIIVNNSKKFWNPEDPTGSIEYSLQNSKAFNKIQDIVLELQERNEDIESQIKSIMNDIKNMKLKSSIIEKELIYIKTQTQIDNNFKAGIKNQVKELKDMLQKKHYQMEMLTKKLKDRKLADEKETPLKENLPITKKNYVLPGFQRTSRNCLGYSATSVGDYQIIPHVEKYPEERWNYIMEQVAGSPKTKKNSLITKESTQPSNPSYQLLNTYENYKNGIKDIKPQQAMQNSFFKSLKDNQQSLEKSESYKKLNMTFNNNDKKATRIIINPYHKYTKSDLEFATKPHKVYL